MKLRLISAVLLVSSTTALSASAEQPWIEDRRMSGGAGIRTGNLELHPSLAGEFGYDSNYFQRAESENPVDSLRFRITPSLTLSTLGAERTQDDAAGASPPLLNFGLAGYATYNAFVPLDDVDDFDDRSRLSGGLRANLLMFPRRPLSWDLHGTYQRQIDPNEIATGNADFDRHNLGGGTGLTWQPGGGLFKWRVGYRFSGTFFSEAGLDALNNARHTIETNGRWRFLPRTSIVYDGYYRLVRFGDDAPANQADGEIIQSRLGLDGLITNRFAFLVMAGWAASFFDPVPTVGSQNFDGPVGNAELKYFLVPAPRLRGGSAQVGLSSLALGYDRSYGHSYLGPFFQRDRGYLTFEYFIGGIIVTSLRGQVARNSYPDFAVAGNTVSDLSETRLGGRLFAEYRLSSAFGINTTISYDRNISGDPNPIPVDGAGAVDDFEFSRFQAFLGARLFW